MKKIAKKPVLFAFLIMLLEPVAASLFISLTAGILNYSLGLDKAVSAVSESLCNILAVLLFTLVVKKWLPREHRLGIGMKGLGLGCLLLLPLLGEALLYVAGGYLAQLFSSGIGMKAVFVNIMRGLAPGITEELVFRGWILGNMLCCWRDKKWGKPMALAISSGMFSLMHLLNLLSGQSITQTLYQMLFTLAMGVIMGAAYIRSGNILAPILFHSFHDFFGFMLLDVVENSASGGANWMQMLLYAVIILYSFFLVRPSKCPEISGIGTGFKNENI